MCTEGGIFQQQILTDFTFGLFTITICFTYYYNMFSGYLYFYNMSSTGNNTIIEFCHDSMNSVELI